MKAEIKGGAAFSYLDIEMAPGDVLITESGAMATMDADLEMKAIVNGGLIKGLLRKYLGGESLFLGRYRNPSSGTRRITLTQGTPGQIREIELAEGESLYMQPGAFVACSETVKLGLSFAGIIPMIAREGLFRIEVSGPGKVWYGAYGALLDKEIKGEYIVDTSHLVAYDKNLKIKLQFAGGIFSSLFGGEGLVMRLEGEGRAVIQSRSMSGLVNWLNPKF